MAAISNMRSILGAGALALVMVAGSAHADGRWPEDHREHPGRHGQPGAIGDIGDVTNPDGRLGGLSPRSPFTLPFRDGRYPYFYYNPLLRGLLDNLQVGQQIMIYRSPYGIIVRQTDRAERPYPEIEKKLERDRAKDGAAPYGDKQPEKSPYK